MICGEFDARDLANLSWAFAKVAEKDGPLIDAIA